MGFAYTKLAELETSGSNLVEAMSLLELFDVGCASVQMLARVMML